jgi:RNA polymerase sigma-70 factor, ECF subfamily
MRPPDLFDQHRPMLFGIAYRMLGSVQDAEDMVQECYLRWQQADITHVESPRAFLATIMTRLCIDQARAARTRRETYIGSWLPEPLEVDMRADPDNAAILAESLGVAFLLLLERLTPVERAVFLLHEVFGYDYHEIAPIVGKSEANSRQIGHRARARIRADRPRFTTAPDEAERITRQFVQTCSQGDMDGLLALLARDVQLHSDGGGKVAAARRPVVGANNVARFILGVAGKLDGEPGVRSTLLNGQPGLVLTVDDVPITAITFDIDAGRIRTLYFVVNPDKLARIPRV